jgi:hypothetical protein
MVVRRINAPLGFCDTPPVHRFRSIAGLTGKKQIPDHRIGLGLENPKKVPAPAGNADCFEWLGKPSGPPTGNFS